MKDRFNIWENEDELVIESYKKDNYRVIENENATTDICYVFFSSNAIYFPNEEKDFYEAIIEKDRYEWMELCNSYFVKKKIRKAIFVRDIYKQFYIRGINKNIDSVDELISLLIKLTRGFRIITVGTSSGGYMATLAGCKLNALYVLNFAGQYVLNSHMGKFVCDALEQGYKYISLVDLIETSKVPLFYFLPYNCENDYIQYKNIKGVPNVYTFSIREKRHGIPISILDVPGVLVSDKERLYRLYLRCQGKGISRIRFHFMQGKYIIHFSYLIHWLFRKLRK